MPWNIVQYDTLPGPKVLESYEAEGWEIFQIIHYSESGKVYVYLRRNIIVAAKGNGPLNRQQRRAIARKSKEEN